MGENRRTVIVTGSRRGIGFAIAEAFARNGDQPIIVDIELEEAEKAAKQLAEKYHVKPVAYKVDVADELSVKDLINHVIKDFNHIDILVNNAGLQHIDPIENFPVEKWDLLVNVMLKGPYLMTKHVIPYMKKRKYGRIINISSVHGKTASPYKCAYISAKHGVIGLTRTVALEVADDNITVNAVLPGVVKTVLIENQLEKLAKEDGTSEEKALLKHLINKQAIKRFIYPEEVAATCLFLTSEGASSITGDSISVSGGW